MKSKMIEIIETCKITIIILVHFIATIIWCIRVIRWPQKLLCLTDGKHF